MPEDTDAFLSRLIIYLSGQNDFVSSGEIVRDRLSGLHSEDEVEPAIERATPFLEFKEDAERGTLFRLSRSFDGYRAVYLLFPEVLSKYELTHLKVALDLAFASDMLKRVPPATNVVIKYEVITQGMLNLETRGGTGIP